MAQTEPQTEAPEPKMTRQDYASDQEVRWCPGCGDYSILAQVQRVLADLRIPRENLVFVSGIGCSSRFPYYMNTYGFHTIHGRALPIATGVKCANTKLSVWVATGDGDALSIGGNHMLHTLRRNMDIKIILFNNRIYGLTKGQTSPTSEMGKVTRSTPMGSIEQPILPVSFAIASEATFVARTIDTEPAHMKEVIRRAALHRGAAFVEVFQNCVIFNDGAFRKQSDKETKADSLVFLEHGKPIVYGRNRDKGFRLNGYRLEGVTLGNGISESDLLVHDEGCDTTLLAFILSRTVRLGLPTPIGIFRACEKPTYDAMLEAQVEEANRQEKKVLLKKLIHSGQVWTVGGNGDKS
ncbi:MAG TPA: 2-oxoacid:ferredoxin oxidoreductase subunit beta [Acidobacteriota bacterium]|nr:2-oxoacid:ferredoxin oxidoreductase subunit beta [Acidobacteriota bacterium]